MSERVLLRLLCGRTSRPHVVGKLVAKEAGQRVIQYKAAVRVAFTGRDSKDFTSADAEWASELGVDAGDAWCAACRQRYPVPGYAVLDSASRKGATFALQGRNGWAKWFHRTRPHMD